MLINTTFTYRDLAESQGVVRPFDILVRMPRRSRHLIAELLHCRLRPDDDPDTQAWRIINQNLRGLQARTHSIPEQLTPFSRNNNWWEIVTRTAQRVGVKYYPGLRDEEVERLLFERLAGLFSGLHLPEEDEVLELLARNHPEFVQAIRSLRLSNEGTRTVLSAILHATMRADEGIREGAQIVGEWIRDRFRWSWALSMSASLRLLQQRLFDVYRTWLSWQPARGNYARVSAALAVIYFQDLVDRTLEEFETFGA